MKKLSETTKVTNAKKKLGQKIKKLREKPCNNLTMRTLAKLVELPPSNMKYIEDGVNAPTADVYSKIIHHLNPGDKLRKEMDSLYTIIRGTPPPDICKIIIDNEGMNDALRCLENKKLNTEQINQLKELLLSFETETIEGEN